MHRNSHENQEPHHLYSIQDKKEGEVFKYGISSDPIEKDGLSKRIRRQLKNLNLGAGRMNSSTLAIGVNADPNGDWYIYLEPNLNFDVKLYKKNYLNFCFNYRFYNGIENYNLKNSDFNGFVFNFGYTLILK